MKGKEIYLFYFLILLIVSFREKLNVYEMKELKCKYYMILYMFLYILYILLFDGNKLIVISIL